MFVMLFAKQQYSSSKVFFYALNSAKAVNILGYQTPLTDYLALQSDCCLATTEGDSLSYFNLFTNNFIRKMPNNNEVRTSVNNSNAHSTPNGATTEQLQSLLGNFLLWDDPKSYRDSLETLFGCFQGNDVSDCPDYRTKVWFHYVELCGLLERLEAFNPRKNNPQNQ